LLRYIVEYWRRAEQISLDCVRYAALGCGGLRMRPGTHTRTRCFYLALHELFGDVASWDASQQEGQGRVLTVPVATPTLPNGSPALMRR
jgi:hypothetical protein